jgi:hypothetical protein
MGHQSGATIPISIPPQVDKDNTKACPPHPKIAAPRHPDLVEGHQSSFINHKWIKSACPA